jgi:hypothetical protein
MAKHVDVLCAARQLIVGTNALRIDQVGLHAVLHFRPGFFTPTGATAPSEKTTSVVTAFVPAMFDYLDEGNRRRCVSQRRLHT